MYVCLFPLITTEQKVMDYNEAVYDYKATTSILLATLPNTAHPDPPNSVSCGHTTNTTGMKTSNGEWH
jgi:hypothetical protein